MVVLEVPCLEGSGNSGLGGFWVWSLLGWAKARLD